MFVKWLDLERGGEDDPCPFPSQTDLSLDPVSRPCGCAARPAHPCRPGTWARRKWEQENCLCGGVDEGSFQDEEGAILGEPYGGGGVIVSLEEEKGRPVALASETNKSRLLPCPRRLPRASGVRAPPPPMQHPPLPAGAWGLAVSPEVSFPGGGGEGAWVLGVGCGDSAELG